MVVESRESITETWMAGTAQLIAAGGDVFTSVLRVTAPREPNAAESRARSLLDKLLTSLGQYDTQTVANTIFPQAIARGATASQLYDRYMNLTYPRLRRLAGNKRGTYFLRLMHVQVRGTDGQFTTRNPLADCIEKMRRQLMRPGPLRAAYELAVYRPDEDSRITMGFPCLSHVSFKLDPKAGHLHLTALYRNQYYIKRAYGNLLGLARLQGFVAREVGLSPGELVCHATHACLDEARNAVEPLLREMRDLVEESVAANVGQSNVER